MDILINDFKSIGSHAALDAFVAKHSLQKRGSESTFIMATYSGASGGNQILVSHRWYDRCKPYVIQEDGNEISIEVKNLAGDVIFKSSVKYVQD